MITAAGLSSLYTNIEKRFSDDTVGLMTTDRSNDDTFHLGSGDAKVVVDLGARGADVMRSLRAEQDKVGALKEFIFALTRKKGRAPVATRGLMVLYRSGRDPWLVQHPVGEGLPKFLAGEP